MSEQEGTLTAAQFEILQLLWEAESGLSVAEIWTKVCEGREVSRTTILNLVDRLEKRNWLQREKIGGVFRYQACVDRSTTEARLASEFVSEYFDGSTSSFVLSLLGSKKVSKSELARLKAILDDSTSTSKSNRKGK